ncbi:MAG: AAA family ATPase [Candidatus Diapherotrites archaeon]|nr:AAA family ATPase [Candidatus Diapherotrites archaeon]
MEQNLFEQEANRQSVFLDRDKITPHYTPDHILFRDEQIKTMTTVLGVALGGKKPDNLFIYGKTGAGKTSTARHVLKDLAEFAKKNAEGKGTSDNSGIQTCYINCRTHNSKYKVLLKAIKDFYPNDNFMGYSATFVYEKLLEFAQTKKCVVVMALDEIDKLKDLDDLIYSLTRCNDELESGAVSLIGISNNLMFKDRLDPRSKSSLCEQEIVFPAYNAQELKEILSERAKVAFRENSVEDSAISLASAIAAKESGDARTAVMLLLRAGEIADKKGVGHVTEEEVKQAKKKVEEEVILNMISTLPRQQQLVLYSIARLARRKSGVRKITGEENESVMFSGDVYNEYVGIAKQLKETVVSSRWYRQYISELEMFGLIVSTMSGKGIRGTTRLIKLGFDAKKIKDALEIEIFGGVQY